ncbi:hypothetical protein [Altererythrobacter sp. ZODW24]|uniref:hypothetical protein n=1 Tax=Altererythrobacter sp. ZODW24 TaxID=2185142 RepID=UPI001965EA2C|nr:hypothetical protein [Altererythrobacter sp. ZODW24]
MAYDYSTSSPAKKKGLLKSKLTLYVGAAALASALIAYATWKNGYWDFASSEPVAISSPALVEGPVEVIPSPTPSAAPTNAEEAAEAVVQMAETQGGIDQRLAAAEQRLTNLDLQAQAAAGNAARAEGLLIAFAARRALERGAELGYLADQLRLRFGDALPNAVAVIISTSRDPVTLEQLVARLDGLAPQLAEAPAEGGFEGLKREIGQLFVVRRESAPSPQPSRRIERARLFLESGRVEAAVAEVQNLPGAEDAASWIEDAQRYAEAMRALDLVETSAVLEPRKLRDGAGNRIEQLSPVGTGNQ